LSQSLVNLLYDIAVFVGLYFLHVPYPLGWATLAAALRFVPYVGPVLGAGAPILVRLAALERWIGPLIVPALCVVLQRFTSLVLETVLYAEAAGVSHVALLSRPWCFDMAVGAARVADGNAADAAPVSLTVMRAVPTTRSSRMSA
jgi:predicted PurR-regulated permease PerM